MATYKDITLSDGQKIRVYVPPSIKLAQMLMTSYPDPKVPVVESKTVTGGVIKMAIEDDPAYLAEKARAEGLRNKKLDELTALYSLKDVKVPDDWNLGEFDWLALMADPDWSPREGKLGRKLDYIEWDLLGNPADAILVQRARAEMAGIDFGVVDQIEASFRSDVEESTD
jgi:hypothetical protein